MPTGRLFARPCWGGEVDGFQHGKSKRWLVHKEQADAFLSQRNKPVEHGEVDVTAPSILNIEATMSLQRIEALLERVVAWFERELEKE